MGLGREGRGKNLGRVGEGKNYKNTFYEKRFKIK